MAKTKKDHGAGAAGIAASTIALVAALCLAPEAGAQCVQLGNDVQCTGVDTDGFDAPNSGITLTVQPAAVVQNDGTNPSIRLIDNSDATIEQGGSVTATGDMLTGVQGGVGNTLTNRGDVIVSGSQTTGVGVGPQGDFVNEATGQVIVSPGLAGVNGIGVRTGTNGSVTNDGLIRADGPVGIGVIALSNGTVTNTGTIHSTGVNGRGVVLSGGSRLDNSGSILATGTDGIGIRFNVDNGLAAQDSQNLGIVRGGDGLGAGVGVADGVNSVFSNELGGVISAASGVAIRGGDLRDDMKNLGTLDGDVLLGDGDDVFRYATGSVVSGTLDGGNGTDTLRIFQADPTNPVSASFDLGKGVGFEALAVGIPTDPGSWTLTGSGSYSDRITLNGGNVQFSDSMIIADPVVARTADVRLGNDVSFLSGITITGGRTIFEAGSTTTAVVPVPPGDPTPPGVVVEFGATAVVEGVSDLAGSIRFDPGSTYEVSYDAATNSELRTTGVVIDPGATLAVIQQGNTSQDRTIRVLEAAGGSLAGEFDSITGGSAFQSITNPVYGASGGVSFLDVSVRTSFTAPAQSPNQNRIGKHLDLASQLPQSPEFAAFLSDLQSLTSAGQGRQALDALHPEFYDVHTSASLQTGGTYAGILARRPLRCEQLVSSHRRNRPSREPCSDRGFTPWVDAFGRYTDRSGDDDFADWSYGGGGIAFGVDHDLSESVLLSGMLGTSRMALDFDGDGDGSVTTFDLGLGGAWRRGGTHVRGAIEYGHGWHDTRRHIEIPSFERLALSDHESDRVTGLLEAGHTFVLAPFEIEPLASLEYTFLHEESFTESNAGVAGLDVDSRSNSLITTRAGARAGMTLIKWAYAGDLLEWTDGVWRPEISASWRQVWNDYDRNLSAKLRGAPAGTPDFRTRTQDAQWGADLGVRVSFQPHGTRSTVELGYEAFVGDGSVSHAAMLRFRMPL